MGNLTKKLRNHYFQLVQSFLPETRLKKGGYLIISKTFFFRNMLQNHREILNCLRRYNKVEDLTRFIFDTPSFLTAMGPSRDGVLIPSDFGADIRKRAHSTNYQASLSTFFSPLPVRFVITEQTLNELYYLLLENLQV